MLLRQVEEYCKAVVAAKIANHEYLHKQAPITAMLEISESPSFPADQSYQA